MAARTDTALLARKRHEKTIAAVRAPRARESFLEIAAAQKSLPSEAEGEGGASTALRMTGLKNP